MTRGSVTSLINISVNDLHAQAAQLLNSVGGDVIEGEAVEAEDDD